MELTKGSVVHYFMSMAEVNAEVVAVHPKGKRLKVRETGTGAVIEFKRDRAGEWRDATKTLRLFEGVGPKGWKRFLRALETV